MTDKEYISARTAAVLFGCSIEAVIADICLSQGINVRLINQEAAEALATIEYRDTKFAHKSE